MASLHHVVIPFLDFCPPRRKAERRGVPQIHDSELDEGQSQELPHPQVRTALGLLKTNPRP